MQAGGVCAGAVLAGGIAVAPVPVSVRLTLALGLAALALIGWTARAANRLGAAELSAGGRRYDAIHEDLEVTGVVGLSAQGSPILEIGYQSRQIVFLDDDGAPQTALTTGPGSAQVVASIDSHDGMQNYQQLLDRSPVALIERGVQTDSGRLVASCLLAGADDAPAVPAELAASTSFPST